MRRSLIVALLALACTSNPSAVAPITDYATFLQHVANWTEPLDATAEQTWLTLHPPQACYTALWRALYEALGNPSDDSGDQIVALMDEATARCTVDPGITS